MDRQGRPAHQGAAEASCYSAPVRIAVVIPALDEAETIARAVESAREPAGPGGASARVDVVVVDGGSRDPTAERARAAGAKVIRSPAGRARQLEVGWRATDGEVVLFLHADTRLPRGYATAIRSALGDESVVGGAFAFRFDQRSPALRIVEWGVRVRVACFGLPYGDQALFARRRVLESIGGVPQVPIMEDLDLVRALARRGRLVLLPLSVTTSARRYGRGRVLRSWARNAVALLAWRLGVDRDRVAAWYGR
jgi:rSAM/selenodomain-associated transferase 2